MLLTISVMTPISVIHRERLKRFWAELVCVLIVYGVMYSRHLYSHEGRLGTLAVADYNLSFDWSTFLKAKRFLGWSFQIPDGWATANWRFDIPYSYLTLGVGISACVFGVFRAIRGDFRARVGILWFIIASLPMLLVNREFPHYIYLPLAGVALVVCTFVSGLRRRLARPVSFTVLVLFCLNHLLLSYQDVREDLHRSWVGNTAVIAKNGARFIVANENRLSDATIIHVINESTESPDFAFVGGDLFRLVTSLRGLRVNIVRKDSEIPYYLDENVILLKFREKQLFDATPELQSRIGRKLMGMVQSEHTEAAAGPFRQTFVFPYFLDGRAEDALWSGVIKLWNSNSSVAEVSFFKQYGLSKTVALRQRGTSLTTAQMGTSFKLDVGGTKQISYETVGGLLEPPERLASGWLMVRSDRSLQARVLITKQDFMGKIITELVIPPQPLVTDVSMLLSFSESRTNVGFALVNPDSTGSARGLIEILDDMRRILSTSQFELLPRDILAQDLRTRFGAASNIAAEVRVRLSKGSVSLVGLRATDTHLTLIPVMNNVSSK